MKKAFISLIISVLTLNVFAQNTKVVDSPSGTVISNVGGDDIPNSNTILEIRSTNKGILIPRMTTTEREAILRPPTGLFVFDTTTEKFWFYDGSGWIRMAVENNIRFGFDLQKPHTLAVSYDIPFVANYNLDPSAVSLLNSTTLQIQRAGLYRFGLLGLKHNESAASAVVSSATYNLSVTVNAKQYNVIVNGMQVGGGSTWSYGSTTLSFDLYIPANATITINALSSTNGGFSKTDTGHFFGYLITE